MAVYVDRLRSVPVSRAWRCLTAKGRRLLANKKETA